MRRTVASSAITALISVLLGGSAVLGPGRTSPAEASAFGASWRMNETVGAMKDATGNGNRGTLHSIRRNGRTYGFNGSTSYVSVRNDRSLNPGGANFKISMRLKLHKRPSAGEDFDLIRKGLAGTKGGDFLLEIRATGRAYCRLRGSSSVVTMQAGPLVADGDWHRIRCVKKATLVRLVVDGTKVAQKSRRVGSISNGSTLYIGAKPGDDFTDGRIDWARLKLA